MEGIWRCFKETSSVRSAQFLPSVCLCVCVCVMILATFRDTFQIQDHLIGEATEEKSQKTTDFWVSGYRVSANLSLCGFPKSNLAQYVCVCV